MFGNVEGRRELLAYIAAIGGRATALDLATLSPSEDIDAVTLGLTALASEGWLETPFGSMQTGDEEGRASWLRRYRPGQAGLQVYEITPAGRVDARSAAIHPIGSRGG
jgi:hypothetical protein